MVLQAASNEEQRRHWNEEAGPVWARRQAEMDRVLEPYGALALDAAEVPPGGSVLDVGCGCGATSLELARRVGPGGRVLGVDLSEPMLARARERAAEADLPQVRFELADAQEHPFPPGSFDRVCSRFGVMFFGDPVRAFGNLRRSLRPDGRMAFVCWQGIDRNAWLRVPMRALAPLVALPPPPEPGAPGPLSLGDETRLRRILEEAGFGEIEIGARELPFAAGAGAEEAAAFFLEVGPVARVLREQPEAPRDRMEEALAAALAPYETERGVELPSAVFVVRARP